MLSELEAGLGYTFRDKSILENALTHSSYANENRERGLRDNERLEFLGDSILGFVVADYLYRSFPDRPEGELTRIRADLVCEKNLARAAGTISLGSFLLLGHGEEHGGGRKRDSIVSDAMESVIAASYMDGGFSAAKEIIDRLILCDVPAGKPHNFDYKTALQELVQRKKDQVLCYELIGESGPDHDKKFEVEVLLNGKPCGKGSGSSKKRAEQAAAAAAIDALFPGELLQDKTKRGCFRAAPFYAPIFFFSSAICSLCIRISDFRKETSSSSSSTRFLGASVSRRTCCPSASLLSFGPMSLSTMTLNIWAIS